MGLAKVSRIWLWITLILLGFSGGIIVGVIVDIDTVYETTVKKVKSRKSSGDIVIDVRTNTDEVKSKKEIRQEKKDHRENSRLKKKSDRKVAKAIKRAAKDN